MSSKKDDDVVLEIEPSQTGEKTSPVVQKAHFSALPFVGGSTSPVAYFEPAWRRSFPPSLCDKSLYVPLSKQVASLLSDSADNGVLAGARKVLDSDYTFPDGRIPHKVSLDVFTRLDDLKDVAEVSEYRDKLIEELSRIQGEAKRRDDVRNISALSEKLRAGESLSPDDVAFLSTFGVTVDDTIRSTGNVTNGE